MRFLLLKNQGVINSEVSRASILNNGIIGYWNRASIGIRSNGAIYHFAWNGLGSAGYCIDIRSDRYILDDRTVCDSEERGTKDMKYLRVTMPDGSQWDVPADKVATHRAKYCAKRDLEDGLDYDQSYQEEYEFTMENEDELLDWAANNMNWRDIARYARKAPIKKAKVDFQEGWINGEKEIVEY